MPSIILKVTEDHGKGSNGRRDIANLLKYAKELPNLQRYCQTLQNQVQDLKYQNQKLERELQVRKKQMLDLTDDIDRLFNERRQLQQFVSRFKNSNEKYLKIKSIAEETVNRLLTEEETFLDLALKAVIEALRMNPDKYNVIYNSKYDDNCNIFDSGSNIATAASSSPSTTTKPQNHNHYYDQYREGILEIANSLLKILTNQIVDNTMVAAVQEKESVSRLCQE